MLCWTRDGWSGTRLITRDDGHHGNSSVLTFLKTLHTAVWVIMTTANFLAFYLALIGSFNRWFISAVLLLGAEIIVIVLNSWRCPLTAITAKYTDERQPNFDIYLPLWLAKNNIKIFGTLIAIEIIIVAAARAAPLT